MNSNSAYVLLTQLLHWNDCAVMVNGAIVSRQHYLHCIISVRLPTVLCLCCFV